MCTFTKRKYYDELNIEPSRKIDYASKLLDVIKRNEDLKNVRGIVLDREEQQEQR